jgi:hypothetical protein
MVDLWMNDVDGLKENPKRFQKRTAERNAQQSEKP